MTITFRNYSSYLNREVESLNEWTLTKRQWFNYLDEKQIVLLANKTSTMKGFGCPIGGSLYDTRNQETPHG